MRKLFSSRNIMFFTFEGAIGAIILNLANPFFSMFARRMGAGDYQIGLVSSLPALVGILALIPGSIIVDKANNKKRIVCTLILLFGIMYPFAAFTPFFGNFKIPLFVTFIALMNWPFSVFNISWQSFFSDVMQSKSNLAYTYRSRTTTIIGTITALSAGLLLAYIPKNDSERIMMYQLFFFISFILALIQSWLLSKVSSEYDLSNKTDNNSYISMIKECFNNLIVYKDFRLFILLSFLFHVTWHMGWPIFFIYQVDVIGINEAWLSYVNVVLGFTGFLTYAFWGKAIEKKGARLIVIVGTSGLAINALTVVFVKVNYMLLLQNTLTGLTFSAFNLAIFANLIEVVPQKNKTMNIALYTTMISISQLFSPLLGVWIYKQTSLVFTLVLLGCLRVLTTSFFVIRYLKSRKF